MDSDKSILDRFEKENPWGLCTAVDLYDCNPKTIRNANKIKEFTIKICKLIDVKRFGEATVVNFGENPRVSGYSLTQLIETSLVSGHFVNQTNSIYMDIFSCKEYPPFKAAEFCKKFFGAKKMNFTVNFRY